MIFDLKRGRRVKNLNHNGSVADRDELTAFHSFVKFPDQHGNEEGGGFGFRRSVLSVKIREIRG